MYEYKFHKINVDIKLRGVVPEEDYREVIKKYASQGYRLVQVFAPPIKGHGIVDYFDLIFEKEI
jgi:hypothetical protein